MEPKKTKPLGFWMVLIAVIAAAAILGMILVHGNRHTGRNEQGQEKPPKGRQEQKEDEPEEAVCVKAWVPLKK